MQRTSTPILACLLVVLPLGLNASAQSNQEPGPHAAIEKYLDSETAIVGWLELSKLDLPATREFLNETGLEQAFAQSLQQLGGLHVALQQLKVDRVYWIGDVAMLLSAPQLVVVPTQNPEAVGLLLKSVLGEADLVTVVEEGVLLVGKSPAIEFLQKKSGTPSVKLLEAMHACSGSFGLAVAFPEYVLPNLLHAVQVSVSDNPLVAQLAPLLAEVRWLAAFGDIPPNSSELQVELSSKQIASELHASIESLVQPLLKTADSRVPLAVRDSAIVFKTGSRQEFSKLLAALGLPGQGKPLHSRQNDLKQVALALHNYHADYQQFPPQSLVNAKGERLLSWRVLILPYLDEEALYEQFHLDEAWDSPHNLKLAEQMPNLFRYSSDAGDAVVKTNILAPMTANSVFGRGGKSVDFRDITDGTSNTMWFVEADPAHAVVWTQPEDLPIDVQSPIRSIIAEGTNGFSASMVDGSVRFFDTQKISDRTLNAMLTINGGERSDDDSR